MVKLQKTKHCYFAKTFNEEQATQIAKKGKLMLALAAHPVCSDRLTDQLVKKPFVFRGFFLFYFWGAGGNGAPLTECRHHRSILLI